jgi:hypothetical protein
MTADRNVLVPICFAALLVVLLLVIAAWDLWALYKGQPAWTVTAIIQEWSRQVPLFPVMVGIVVGHLFFPSRFVPPPLP